MNHKSLSLQITGVCPLLLHNGQLANPMNKFAQDMKKVSGKRDKTEADFMELSRLEWYGSLYLHEGKLCIPGEMIEAVLIEASKKRKRGMQAKAGIICDSNYLLEYDGPKDPHELWENPAYRLVTGVKVQKNRVMRTRPIFPEWGAKIEIKFLPSLLNENEVSDFLKLGGEIIGLGDWRPKFGRFNVSSI